MTAGSFATRDTLKLNAAVRKAHQRSTVQTLTGSRKRFHHMHRTPGSADYHSNLQTFLHILSEAQMKAHADDNTVKAIGVYHETGRKFDKVFIATINQKDKSAPAVRYFIRRTDGSIFGAKSPVAPNLKWYFGNVYEADLWDWSGYHGVPLDFDAETGESKAAGVKAAGAYGEYQHFEPSDPARARALAKA